MAGRGASRLAIGVQEIFVGARGAAQQQTLGDHDPDGQGQHQAQDDDHRPGVDRQGLEQDAEIVVAAAFGLFGRIEAQQSGALAFRGRRQLEDGLRQGDARHAELVHLAAESRAQGRRPGADRACDLARRLTVDVEHRLRAVVDHSDMGPGSGRQGGARAALAVGVQEQGRALRHQAQARGCEQLAVGGGLDPEADRDRTAGDGLGRNRHARAAVQRQAGADQAAGVAALAACAVQAVGGGVRAGRPTHRNARPDDSPGHRFRRRSGRPRPCRCRSRRRSPGPAPGLIPGHVDPDQGLLLVRRPLLDVEGQGRAVVARHEPQVRPVLLDVGEVEVAGMQPHQNRRARHFSRHARALRVDVDLRPIGVVALPPTRRQDRRRHRRKA